MGVITLRVVGSVHVTTARGSPPRAAPSQALFALVSFACRSHSSLPSSAGCEQRNQVVRIGERLNISRYLHRIAGQAGSQQRLE
jgi:hypothetical protein